MQSGEAVDHEEQMTLSPSPAPSDASPPITCPPLASLPANSPSLASSPPATSPSLASSPPITSQISPSLTSKSNLRTTSTLLQLDKQASLANKLRLSKILGNHASPPSFNVRSSLIGEDDDEGRSDIRVLSPSLVNSQVLSKTRPLSPDPPDPPITDLHNGDRRGVEQEVVGGGGRRAAEGGRGAADAQDDADKTTKGRGRGRRRQRLFKLKFHHQALPPEYLDHYEASLRQEQRAAAAATASPAATPAAARHHREALPPDSQLPLDARDAPTPGLQGGVPRAGRGGRGRGRGRGQRSPRPITIHEAGAGATEALLRDLLMTRPQLQQAALQQVALARAQSVPSIMLASQPGPRGPPSPGAAGPEDHLPYMGEMLLDTRPRRGRKPKKADITHLISKNYGGAGLAAAAMMQEAAAGLQHPLHHLQQQLEQQQQQQLQLQRQHEGAEAGAYTMMEHESLARSHSYTSLLHSALTAAHAQDQSEPLNLCVRDAPLKCEPEHPAHAHHPAVKLEPPSHADDDDVTREGGMSSPEVAWAGGGRLGVPTHWLHDYRLKTEDGLSSGQSTPSLCSQSSHMPSLSPHMSPPPPLGSPHMNLSPHFLASPQSPHSPSPVPAASPLPPAHHHRHVHALLKESLQQRLDEAARERLSPQETVPKERGARPGTKGSTGARRKRSALFIPPADPSTEVSICKFKFTGGPNPILEEKKMVSVDAGGTLRYSTGGGVARDSRAAAAQMRLTGKLLDNITKCEKDVKKIRLESDTEDTCSLPGMGSTTTSPVSTLERGVQPPMLAPPMEDSPKRKRRSKKSSVREKLEQTLRERGLLIQTQQVESAEGATYCKFRQLRKFTRYLFRSWKDYLPGQLQEAGITLEGFPDARHPPFPHHLARGPPTPDHR